MSELEKDPEYLKRRAKKQERFAKIREQQAALQQPLMARLAELGIEASSTWDAIKEHAPFQADVVNILLDALKNTTDARFQEALVRALGAAAAPFDGRPLAELYDSTLSPGLMFAITNTIAMTHPHSIDDWLETMKKNPGFRKTLEDLSTE